MSNPKVTFVIPCFKLAHLLPDCVNSILAQSYTDFEILIMDDCSPDNTPEVASSFKDGRVKHIRNEPNLGHLKNYNKGIDLAKGTYVWLISADDRLRSTYVLEQYVELMESHPRVGIVCCPGIALRDGQENGLVDCGYYGSRDKIFDGTRFIAVSLQLGHSLLAPSVMARKACYETITKFPEDMPHMGDMYLWFRWAMEYDVAYMSEPMVNYRLHDLNIMKHLLTRAPEVVFNDEVQVLWRTRRHCVQLHLLNLARQCEEALGWKYARAAAAQLYGGSYWDHWGQLDWADALCRWHMDEADCDKAIRAYASSDEDYKRLHAKFLSYLGNQHWRRSGFEDARRSYISSLRDYRRTPTTWLKLLVLSLRLGSAALFIESFLRRALTDLRIFRRWVYSSLNAGTLRQQSEVRE